MGGTAALGIMGKHPDYGDFIRAGLSDPVAEGLSAWLDKTLFDLREAMGDGWRPFWDGAQDLRFWIGRAVLGVTLAGLFRPSRDRVGRRYPLLLLAEAVDLPPPVVAPDQTFHDRLALHLEAMQPGQGASALLDGLDVAPPAESAEHLAEGPVIWAHHPDGDLGALLGAAAPVDALRAQTARSHWWAPGGAGRAATWLAADGLPTAQALGWLLAGVAADASATPEAAHGQ